MLLICRICALCPTAPRIPPDKRIFTTSHTPSCLFQEVDERSVHHLRCLLATVGTIAASICFHFQTYHRKNELRVVFFCFVYINIFATVEYNPRVLIVALILAQLVH